MKKLKTDSVSFTVIITVAFFLLLGAVSLPMDVIFADSISVYDLEAYCWINAIAQLALALAILAVMQKIGVFCKHEYACKPIGKGLVMGLVGIIYALVMFSINYFGSIEYARPPDISYLLSGLFIAFTTGLFEEVLVRGFAYNNFKKHFGDTLEGIKKALLWSSLLFGIAHIVNLRGYDLASVLETVDQMISAVIIGLYLGLVYVKSKSMWSVVIIHAMIDEATFVLFSLLLPEVFNAGGAEIISKTEIVLQSLIIPLSMMLPFVIAVIIKWRKLSIDLS